MIKAGNYRNKVLIESKANAQDAYGAITETWSTYATWWAQIQPLSGREYVEAAKVNSEVGVKMKGRYISGVTPIMRAKFGTRIYAVVAVINIEERGREMELFCKEIS